MKPEIDETTRRVRSFYETYSFPGYNEFDTADSLLQRARQGRYAALLESQIPYGACVLDVGCGTGQLVNVLALAKRRAVGMDLSYASLCKGMEFRNRWGIERASFVQGSLFDLPFKYESFDVVLANGVLHHTADPRGGFRSVVKLLKPGGLVVVGLYNRLGRAGMKVRKLLFHLMGRGARVFDAQLRNRRFGEERKTIWLMDQYYHPHESSHSVDEVLRWFDEERIQFLNAVPKISLTEDFSSDEQLFASHRQGSRTEHFLKQAGWMVTLSKEGGFFVMIGRRR
ncbi:MAG: 2-polyprenyl-3-methyl-5-hydroxy-6-metoxy-1,4-benzoquinol methylase [Ignavibacteriales bacterium CG07_land_8_20_14_0_80_59_12]|nr:MAG: 2-polyprenyl-3-methyl-5-hydroxy-6-metoxy-1,4-benzoquinol methylase [Ignavibacteriales bacterium CG07_land_8_20_14_0_80_59_12]